MLFGNEISFLVSDPGLKNYSSFFFISLFVSEFLLDSAKNRLIEYYQSRTASDSFHFQRLTYLHKIGEVSFSIHREDEI